MLGAAPWMLCLLAIFLMLSHEPNLNLHHGHYLVDLVKFVLGVTGLSVVEVCPPNVSEEVVATELRLLGY